MMAAANQREREGVVRRAPQAVFYTLLALVLATPLPFGAYPVWAWATLAAGCGALLLCWGTGAVAGRIRVAALPRSVRFAAVALALAMAWALMQTAGLTPEAWHHPIWRESALALATPYSGAVSVDPAASREGLLRIASYAAIFWLSFQCVGNGRHARRALKGMAAAAACYALYGMAAMFLGSECILWVDKTAYLDAVTGTFVNPNSFAAYCGIGLLCATGVLAERFKPGTGGMRRQVARLLAEFLPRNGVFIAVWLVLAAALPLTLSRAGIATTCVAFVVLVFALGAHRIGARRALVRSASIAAVGGAVLLAASQGLERHFWEAPDDWAKRSEIYAVTVDAISDAPLSGTGLGTFESAYRSYRSEHDRAGVRMAHNDYLELALELGIPAATLFVSALLAVFVGCVRGLFARQRDIVVPAVGVSACVLVGAHSLVDFSLQIPAVAATFAFVLGIATAQSRPS